MSCGSCTKAKVPTSCPSLTYATHVDTWDTEKKKRCQKHRQHNIYGIPHFYPLFCVHHSHFNIKSEFLFCIHTYYNGTEPVFSFIIIIFFLCELHENKNTSIIYSNYISCFFFHLFSVQCTLYIVQCWDNEDEIVVQFVSNSIVHHRLFHVFMVRKRQGELFIYCIRCYSITFFIKFHLCVGGLSAESTQHSAAQHIIWHKRTFNSLGQVLCLTKPPRNKGFEQASFRSLTVPASTTANVEQKTCWIRPEMFNFVFSSCCKMNRKKNWIIKKKETGLNAACAMLMPSAPHEHAMLRSWMVANCTENSIYKYSLEYAIIQHQFTHALNCDWRWPILSSKN